MKRKKFLSHPGKLQPREWKVSQEERFTCIQTVVPIQAEGFDWIHIRPGAEITVISAAKFIHAAIEAIDLNGEDATFLVKFEKKLLATNFERKK